MWNSPKLLSFLIILVLSFSHSSFAANNHAAPGKKISIPGTKSLKNKSHKFPRGKRVFSNIRLPNETFIEALTRTKSEASVNQDASQAFIDQSQEQQEYQEQQDDSESDNSVSAVDARTPLDLIDFSTMEDWGSMELLESAFVSGRDSRFLDWTMEEGFGGFTVPPSMMRRIPWMYPRNGCFYRAEMLKERLVLFGFPSTRKLFAFGEFSVNSPNYYKTISWWYHMVVAARVGDSIYIFDPSMDDQRVLEMNEWVEMLNHSDPDDPVMYSLCGPDTYNAGDKCRNPEPIHPNALERHFEDLLEYEWENLTDLDRDPELELAEDPPWRRRIHTWIAGDTGGQLGDVYAHYNGLTTTVNYFELIGFNEDGTYGFFPIDNGNNEYWHYLGDTLENAYVKDISSLQSKPYEDEILDVYAVFNRQTSTTEFYRQVKLQDGAVLPPFSKSNDAYNWDYLGTDYPIIFKNEPKQWADSDTTAEIGDIYQYENPVTNKIDFYRLTRYDKALVVYPEKHQMRVFNRLFRKSARWRIKKIKRYLKNHNIEYSETKTYQPFPIDQSDTPYWEFLHSR